MWSDEPEWGDVQAATRKREADHQIHVSENIDYADVQLPRNYKYHAMAGGEFDEKGGCVFTSRRQMERTTDIANHHGERIMWNKPFSRYGSFD